MNFFPITRRVFLAIFILLLNGCGGTPNVQVSEVSNSNTSYDETIHINNCGGKAESEQIKERSFSTNVEGGLEVGVQQVVEGVVSAKYSQSRNTSVSQKLVAPAGTDMEFVLRWKEEVRAGNVIVDGKTGTYTVKIPIAVEQVSSQDLGCLSGVQITVPPPTGNQPTAQTFNFGGQCASVPINLTDNLEVQLDPSRWYLIEEYNNQASPPTHIFRSQIGNISVNANAVRGLRAWECRGESEAFSQAQLNSIGYKQNNPSHKVLGPDGQEVK